MSDPERGTCARKLQLLAAYRAAVSRYSEALNDVSFGFHRVVHGKEFDTEWAVLEAHRNAAEQARVELLIHIENHEC